MAESSFPGITRFYASLDEKPATFLQLVWAFEDRPKVQPVCRKRRRR